MKLIVLLNTFIAIQSISLKWFKDKVITRKQNIKQAGILDKNDQYIDLPHPMQRNLTLEGEVYVRQYHKQIEMEAVDQLQVMSYRLETKFMSFIDDNDKYQKVLAAIKLQDVVQQEEDDIENGKCCVNVEDVHKADLLADNFFGYCFKIYENEQDFLLCQKQKGEAEYLRSKIVENIVYNWLKIHSITMYHENVFNQKRCHMDFTWDQFEQEQWDCECQGKLQSPIPLDEHKTVWVSDILRFSLFEQQIVMYGFVDNEPEFYAEWGSFSHISSHFEHTYQIYKIAFKVSDSEHQQRWIDSRNIYGEVLMYGKYQEQEAILSVLLETSEQESTFLEQMNIESWTYPFRNKKTDNIKEKLICLDIIKKDDKYLFPNLKNLLSNDRRLEVNGDISFFYYYGSQSKPPCKDTKRYVLKYPARMSNYQYQLLSQYVLIDTNLVTNIRYPQPINNRTVWFHNVTECHPEKKEQNIWLKLEENYTKYDLKDPMTVRDIKIGNYSLEVDGDQQKQRRNGGRESDAMEMARNNPQEMVDSLAKKFLDFINNYRV